MNETTTAAQAAAVAEQGASGAPKKAARTRGPERPRPNSNGRKETGHAHVLWLQLLNRVLCGFKRLQAQARAANATITNLLRGLRCLRLVCRSWHSGGKF
jgi:hypothetical protein